VEDTGERFNSRGGVDFSKSTYLYRAPGVNPIVRIQYSGNHNQDIRLANAKAHLTSKPKDYVWHHLDDYDKDTNEGTMQLVWQPAHQAYAHYGGTAQYKAATGRAYTLY
jgi:hypothetical protein